MLKKIADVLAAIGVVMIFLAVGCSDFYITRMHRQEPTSVSFVFWLGVLLIFPTVFRLIAELVLRRRR